MVEVRELDGGCEVMMLKGGSVSHFVSRVEFPLEQSELFGFGVFEVEVALELFEGVGDFQEVLLREEELVVSFLRFLDQSFEREHDAVLLEIVLESLCLVAAESGSISDGGNLLVIRLFGGDLVIEDGGAFCSD